MDDRACPECGAQIRADAAYCWQCYAPVYGGTAGAAVASSGSMTRGALAEDAPAWTSAPAPGQTAPVGRARPVLGWAISGLVFLAAAVGGWFAWQAAFGGYDFPEEVGGQPRLESQTAQDAAELVTGIMEAFDVTVEAAFYGSGERPTYALMALEVPDDLPLEQIGGELTVSGATAGSLPSRDSGGMLCQAGPVGPGAGCAWWDGDVLVILGGSSADPNFRITAEQVQADLVG